MPPLKSPQRKPFVKTPRQIEALNLLNHHRHTLLYGGARSGKTFITIRNIFIRASKRTSKHLILRYRFNHARTSLAHETVPAVIRECFPKAKIVENKHDGYWTVPAEDGGWSQVWLGGTDDKDRTEKVLGSEYSTIYVNEASQVPWEAIPILWTRLAETSGLPLRFYYDCNPPTKKHWTYPLFFDGHMPSGDPHDLDVAKLQINPIHNQANLPPEFLATLAALPKRQRQRFLEGLYLTDVEGALWTDAALTQAKLKEPGDLRKTVVSVDPSVTSNPRSDECGIIVCSLDAERQGVVQDDHSGRLSTRDWAQRVVALFHAYEANEVVAEANQGGDLVKDAIHNADPHVPVVLVRASKGKFARAEPVAQLYELGKVAHTKDMPHLESELTETVFTDIRESPNRLDALVWGLTHLMIGQTPSRYHFG